jgi:hypothetical protein
MAKILTLFQVACEPFVDCDRFYDGSWYTSVSVGPEWYHFAIGAIIILFTIGWAKDELLEFLA